MSSEKLDRTTLIGYGMGGLSNYAIMSCIGFYLIFFYTEVIHLDITYVTWALSIAMVIDAFSDPIMGYISDNISWKWERRRPFFIIGSIPSGIAIYFMFAPPDGYSQEQLFYFLLIVMASLRTFFTVFATPHLSLAPELTYDYNERTRLAGYRRALETCGECIGTIVPSLIVLALPAMILSSVWQPTSGDWLALFVNKIVQFFIGPYAYQLVGAILGLVIVYCGFIAYIGTWERKVDGEKVKSNYSFFEGTTTALKNRPFLILLIPLTLTMISDRIVWAELMYILQFFYHKGVDEVYNFIPFYFVGVILSVPGWLALSKKIGKKKSYIFSLLFYPLTMILLVGHPWSDDMLIVSIMTIGIAIGGVYTIPFSILPDIVEWDQIKTQERREGAYMGLVTFVMKLGMGLSLLILSVLLPYIGYEEGKAPSKRTVDLLRLNFALIPIILLFIGAVAFLKFPITKEKYEELLEKLKEK